MIFNENFKLPYSLFLTQINQNKMFLDLVAINTGSSKSRKIDISPKGLTMVLVQKWPFFQFFF